MDLLNNYQKQKNEYDEKNHLKVSIEATGDLTVDSSLAFKKFFNIDHQGHNIFELFEMFFSRKKINQTTTLFELKNQRFYKYLAEFSKEQDNRYEVKLTKIDPILTLKVVQLFEQDIKEQISNIEDLIEDYILTKKEMIKADIQYRPINYGSDLFISSNEGKMLFTNIATLIAMVNQVLDEKISLVTLKTQQIRDANTLTAVLAGGAINQEKIFKNIRFGEHETNIAQFISVVESTIRGLDIKVCIKGYHSKAREDKTEMTFKIEDKTRTDTSEIRFTV